MREPAFWWRKPGLLSALLAPVAAGYGAIAARRMAQQGVRASVPVLCVGNFTLGGAGKTPTAIAIAKILQQAGERPFCLSRGYGGSLAGPKIVDAQSDVASAVGDEALLLAHAAPAIVARDRVAGAAAARAAGASVIVMDDGLQNASLVKDFTLAVVDGRRGTGNGKVFPAGPLRAPINAQWARTDALLVVGVISGAAEAVAAAKARGLPVLHARLAARCRRRHRVRRQAGARLRRHRRSGQILCDRCGCRHRRAAAPGISRPSPLHGRGSRRAGDAGRA